MIITDPIADMLTRIRNAQAVGKETVICPYSKLKFEIAKILKRENFIGEMEKENNFLHLKLKYINNQPIISGLKRISKPGRRIYLKKHELPRIKNDFGLAIISTSSGLMTNKEAERKKIGGEIICEVW